MLGIIGSELNGLLLHIGFVLTAIMIYWFDSNSVTLSVSNQNLMDYLMYGNDCYCYYHLN